MYDIGFAQQGWQCPVCKRVYSPWTAQCYYCGEKTYTTSTDTARITYGEGVNIEERTAHINASESSGTSRR